MKTSIQWLKDYVPVSVSPEKLAHRLTMSGLEVEKVASVNGDHVFELEITPNRPDCLSMIGIARETAAIFNKTLKLPKVRKVKLPTKKCDIEILDKQDCPRYIGTVIRDVEVAASVAWMVKRIAAVGLRPINNIVDITNFCLMETGQPLHAFDYDKLIGGKIVVRRARKGETIVTLDGVQRTLDPSILVIADAKRPVAVAGIMGGTNTEVTSATKNILLESAYFDPILIRRAARKLGVSSDSSYRFERGVDMAMVEGGATRARALIKECGEGLLQEHRDVFPGKRRIAKTNLEVSLNQINSLLGATLTASQCKTILKKLGFQVALKDRKLLKIIVPSFRADVKGVVDVIEEVARVVGYDHLPMSLPTISVSGIPESRPRQLRQEVQQAIWKQGFQETITYAMINQNDLNRTKLGSLSSVRVANPLTQDQEIMRPHLLPSLLGVMRFNVNRGQKTLRLFEVGKIYAEAEEREVLGILMSGVRHEDWRILKKEALGFYDLQGVVARVCEQLGVKDVQTVPQEESFAALGQTASLMVGKKEVGRLGKIDEEVLANWDIRCDEVFFAQLDLERLASQAIPKGYAAPSEYPAITRDISLAVKRDVSFQQIKDIIMKLGAGNFLADVRFVEQYTGVKIPEDQRGLVFSLVYQSSRRTLTEEEINKIHQNICQTLIDQLGAIIR